MIDSEERKKIAAKLRAVRDEMENEKPPATPWAAAVVYLQRIGRCVELDEVGNLFYRLADLIDVPTCHDMWSDDWQAFNCSECGTIVEYDLDSYGSLIYNRDEQKGKEIRHYPIKYCPYCGAEVEQPDE